MTGARVAYLVTDFKVGGAQTQIIEVGGRLRRRGWKVEVVSMVPPVALTDELDRAGLPVQDLGMRLGAPDPRGWLRLVALLRRLRPDVVHCHLVHANLLGRSVRPFVDVQALLCTAHNVVEGGRWLELGYRVTDRWSDLTTQVCRAGVDRYHAEGLVPSGRIAVVPNGVDVDRFRPPDEPRGSDEPFVWLAAGRLEAQKDHATLLDAFEELTSRGRHAVLRIAGDGSLRGELERRAERVGGPGTVELLGPRADLPDLLREVDGFVSSSRWEGLPLVLLEASASGLPVVATDVGGTSDAVVDGETGTLVPPGAPAALAEAMDRVMALSDDDRRAVGDRGRRRVELHFDLERVVERWEGIYRDLLSGDR